jgi:hypothetical protein
MTRSITARFADVKDEVSAAFRNEVVPRGDGTWYINLRNTRIIEEQNGLLFPHS